MMRRSPVPCLAVRAGPFGPTFLMPSATIRPDVRPLLPPPTIDPGYHREKVIQPAAARVPRPVLTVLNCLPSLPYHSLPGLQTSDGGPSCYSPAVPRMALVSLRVAVVVAASTPTAPKAEKFGTRLARQHVHGLFPVSPHY